MQQPEYTIEDIPEGLHGLDGLRAAKRGFRELDIDVGELAPDERLERDEVLAEEIAVDQARGLADRRVAARKDPAGGLALHDWTLIRSVPLERLGVIVHLLQDEAADVPKL